MRRVGVVAAALVLGLGTLLAGAKSAGAHRSGCHSQHTCPSDANPPSYRCGDKGTGCNYPNAPSGSSNSAPQLSGPPTASDCANYPQYYDPSVCSHSAPRTAPPAQPPAGGGGGASSSSCGVERWAVKTGSDADRNAVNLTASTRTTIAYLTSLAGPGSLPTNNRIAPVETRQWTIDATLVEYKLETDSDVHLVLHDSAGRSMIAEIPNPSCVSTISPMRSRIASARAAFDSRFDPIEGWRYTSSPITITGPGFWDYKHGQTGVAPNAIEIHPVLLLGAPANPPAVGAPVAPGPATAPSPSVQIETAGPSPTGASEGGGVAHEGKEAVPRTTAAPSAAATAIGFVVFFALLGAAGYGVYRLVRHFRHRHA